MYDSFQYVKKYHGFPAQKIVTWDIQILNVHSESAGFTGS